MNNKKVIHFSSKLAILTGAAAIVATGSPSAQAMTSVDSLLDKLQQKGILSSDEAKELRNENDAESTNMVNMLPPSKWKVSDAIKSMQLYGDLRFRYEYRGAENAPGLVPNTFYRERFRYALRIGLKGDLYDDFNYGIRLETAANPRSPWDTFGNNTSAGSVTPSDKNTSGINLGQAFLGWHPEDWYEMTIGRMPMPLYTTPMVWDSDINPEGAFEKFKYTIDAVDLFADFGQFDYQDPGSATTSPSGDTFLLAWQAGANVRLGKDMSFKVAPMLYTYSGGGSSGGLNGTFVGQGLNGVNVGVPGGSNVAKYNEQGINDLMILEVPAEFNFKINHSPLGALQARFFGDFAYNVQGDDRARAAFATNPGAFPGGVQTGNNIAYQVGFGIGSATQFGPTTGLVYGSYAKKNSWEARAYWQHIEQYALDVNLIDSDFFEGRANLQGVYLAFAYSITDAIIGTVRYGYASRINDNLGTGGSNLDMPGLNPIQYYNLLQLDVTWKF
jgi:Putative porin